MLIGDILTECAVRGDASAMYALGMQLFYDEDGEKLSKESLNKAADWFVKAAMKGYADAQYMAGHCFFYGEGRESDIQKGLKCLLAAAKSNHSGAQYVLGEYYYNERNYFEAVKWYVLAAGQNHQEALRMLAECYNNGLGTAPDEVKAQIYKRKSESLYEKEKAERDRLKSADPQVRWEYKLLRAYEEKKDTGALLSLIRHYIENEKFTDTLKLSQRGADGGNTDCMRVLACLYESGLGIPPDKGKAMQLLLDAYEKGNAAAARDISLRYFKGGTDFGKSKGKGMKWLFASAVHGDVYAFEELKRIKPKLAQKAQRLKGELQ